MKTSEFYVIAVCSNPVRYKSRARLFENFRKHMEKAGVQLLIVEAAYGKRPFEVTDPSNPWHCCLRTDSEIWHKENMVNLGVQRLTQLKPNWKYMSFIDADIDFLRPDWVAETVHQLQHHKVVQMFQHAVDLGPCGETFGKYDGFACAYVEGKFKPDTYKYTSFHPGYAWAMTRKAFEDLGGLIETAAMGAGDRHMAYGLVGMLEASIHPGLSPAYATNLLQWQVRAERYIQRNLGFVSGTLIHHWHGKKADRKYHDRWKVLVDCQYNPDTDIKRDAQGLFQLEVISARQIKLRDKIRAYFRSRNEDSIDLV